MALFNTSVSNVLLKKTIKKEFLAKIEVCSLNFFL